MVEKAGRSESVVAVNEKQVSKFLSYVLRHAPGEAGLILDSGGWVSVDDLSCKRSR